MDFEKPDAYQALVNKAVGAGTRGEAWDEIGEPLNSGVDQVIPAYDAKLELNLSPKTPEKRQEVNELRWGKIKKDAARLEGLAAAMENIVSVVKSGKDKLAHDWKGESFEAFKVAVDRVEKTLTDYAGACKTTAGGLTSAMDSAEQLYSTYADTSVGIFDFSAYPKADDWKKVEQSDMDQFAETCGDWHEWTFNCDKDDGDGDEMVGKLATPEMLEWFDSNECDESGDKVRSMAKDVVSKSEETRQSIREKIHGWYVATDDLKDNVTELQDAALENLRIMAELKVFGLMKVPGAPTGDGGGKDDGGSGKDDGGGGTGTGGGGTGTGGGGTGGGGTGGGGTGGAPAFTPPSPPPMPELPTDSSLTDPSSLEPGATDPNADPNGQGTPGLNGQPETVKIEEDGRTIEVTSPDSQGQVTVTVDDGTGTPKTYTMDFGAAPTGTGLPGGGQGPEGVQGQPGFGPEGAPAGQAPGAEGELIRAGEDGKAVISDPPMTITAERPGGGDTVVVTVDDGSGGEPTTYTLDYSDPTQPPTATPDGIGTQPTEGRMPEQLIGRPGGSEGGFAGGPAEWVQADSGFAGQDRFTEPSQAGGFGGGGQGAAGFESGQGGGFGAGGQGQAGFTEPGQGGGFGGGGQGQAGFTEPGQGGGFAAGGQGQAAGFTEPGQGGGFGAGGQGQAGFTEPSQGGGFGAGGQGQAGFTEPDYQGTSAQAASLDGGSWGSVGGALGADEQPPGLGPTVQAATEASLASAAANVGDGQQSGGAAGAGMGGGMMGGAGGGAQGGGDSDRQSGQWRTTGNLFDDDVTEAERRVIDALGEIR